MTPRVLAVLSLVFAIWGPILLQAVRGVLPGPVEDNLTFGFLFTHPLPTAGHLLLTGFYPAVPWMAYVCARLAIGKLDLNSRRTAAWLTAGGACLAAASWTISGLLMGILLHLSPTGAAVLLLAGEDPPVPEESWTWLVSASPYSSMPLELLHTIGTGMTALGILLLTGRVISQIIDALAPAGSTTLTLYSGHLVFLATGLLDERPFESFALQTSAALLFGVHWRKLVGRGPLEAASRLLPRRPRTRWPARKTTDRRNTGWTTPDRRGPRALGAEGRATARDPNAAAAACRGLGDLWHGVLRGDVRVAEDRLLTVRAKHRDGSTGGWVMGSVVYVVQAADEPTPAAERLSGPVRIGPFPPVALLKWAVVGRYRPRVEPPWRTFVRRSEFLTGVYESAAVPSLIGMLVGTPLIGPVLRLFGAKIGKRTYIDTTYLTEFDLVHIGDDACISSLTSLQTHLFEDRVMKMSHVRIGVGASVGTRAVVLYDTAVGDGATVDALSLVMKGEQLLPDTNWRGIPVRTTAVLVPGRNLAPMQALSNPAGTVGSVASPGPGAVSRA